MIHVMDGVRPTVRRQQTLTLRTPKPAVVTLPARPQAYAVGMDGIRRPVMPTPRDAVVNMQAAIETPVWQMPSLRLPQIAWRRPAIAFGLVATALVASTAMAGVLATPANSTARAAGHSASASRPAVAPVAAPAAAVAVPQKTGLQELLNTFGAANANKFGMVVKDLTTGETASINPDRQIESASLYKLFVAQRIYQQVDLGQLTYGKAAGGGTGRTIDGCLTVMINVSDNDCGRALGAILGWGSQDKALEIEGYNQTTLASPQQTSAADVATLLTRLYNGTLVSGNSSEKFLGLLKDQRVNNRLPMGLPAGTVIAHKTGDLDDVVHDAGIVYGPKTNYLVVATSGTWSSPGNAPAQFAEISKQLWNYFEN